MPAAFLSGQSRDFRRGLMMGLVIAFVVIGAMAAGSRSQNPTTVINALMERGVQIDPRVARQNASVRRSLLCVALNVMMEARGELDKGQVAVAWVTYTRAMERDLSPCGVVFEWLGAAQFSWSSKSVKSIVGTVAGDQASFLEAQDVAWRVMVEQTPDPTKGANHFWGHNAIRPPAWSRQALPGSRVVIGAHTFVRLADRRAAWIPIR